MTIWAIADIHASPLDDSGTPDKPMEIFGAHWDRHVERIEQSWNDLVGDGDTIIVAGDIDWSLRLATAMQTLNRMATWRGHKILVRGNHDFWWSSGSTSKVQTVLPVGMSLLHNNSFAVEGFNIVGCKGSPVPGGPEWSEVDAKLLNRETERLKLSLATRDVGLKSLAAIHYPPFFASSGTTPYTHLFCETGVVVCVYGHLHAEGSRFGVEGDHDGVRYRLVAADHVNFRPVPIAGDGTVFDPAT